MASTHTAPSKSKASPSDDAVVELQPPPETGFPGTTKLWATQTALIAELEKRGYTRVVRG